MYKNSQELQDGGYKITMQASSYSVSFILWKLWLKTTCVTLGYAVGPKINIKTYKESVFLKIFKTSIS